MTIDADAERRRKEAAEWFSKLNQRKVTTADVRAFSAWRKNPENARAFRRLEAMWEATAPLSASPVMSGLAEEALNRAAIRGRKRVTVSGRLLSLGVAGALVVTLCAGGLALWSASRPQRYDTAIGEQRTVRLSDGSRIVLDTRSRVTVRYTGSQRRVTLASGRAMFEVQGDPKRPFLVQAGDTEITAIGTRFDVRRAGAGARVLLVEGRVDVRKPSSPDQTWRLAPGQQVTTSIRSPRIAAVSVPSETSWTQGRLTFDNTPIAAAVAEMNRYSTTRVELRDDRISSIRVSGVFNAGDVDGFVAALRDLYALEVVTTGDGDVVLSAPA